MKSIDQAIINDDFDIWTNKAHINKRSRRLNQQIPILLRYTKYQQSTFESKADENKHSLPASISRLL